MKVKVQQVDQGFQLSSSNGSEEIQIGVSQEYQKDTKGLRQMELLLSGLGACLSIDILNLTKKMRIDLNGLNVSVNGVRDIEPPKAFNAINIEISCSGEIKEEKIVTVIKKVIDEHCSVIHSLNPAIHLNVHILVNDEKINYN